MVVQPVLACQLYKTRRLRPSMWVEGGRGGRCEGGAYADKPCGTGGGGALGLDGEVGAVGDDGGGMGGSKVSEEMCRRGGGFCREGYCPSTVYRNADGSDQGEWKQTNKCWLCPESLNSGLVEPLEAREKWERFELCEHCLGAYFSSCLCGREVEQSFVCM